MRVGKSRMELIATVEDTSKLVRSWRSSLPNANSMGKLSLGLGASWLCSRAVSFYLSKRSAGGAKALATAATPSASIFRYLLLQGCTMVLLPLIRNKVTEKISPDFMKSMAKPDLDQIFYRWLGLES